MERLTLCGKCADRIRSRNLVHLVERRLDVQKICDNCKRRRYVALYEVEPMWKPPKEVEL